MSVVDLVLLGIIYMMTCCERTNLLGRPYFKTVVRMKNRVSILGRCIQERLMEENHE